MRVVASLLHASHQRCLLSSDGGLAMTPVFSVIGENRDDPDHLLLIGADGQYYQYRLLDGTTTPTDPDDTWVIDPNPLPPETLFGET